MESAGVLIQRAKEIRERLRRPANAVEDRGINLKKNRIPPKPSYPPIPAMHEPGQPKKIVAWDQKVIECHIPPPLAENRLRFEAVAMAVCDMFNISFADLKGRCRQQWVVIPRHIAIFLAMKYCRHGYRSSTSIGRLFDRDHSSVLHAQGKIATRLLNDERLQTIVAKLERDLFHGLPRYDSGRSAAAGLSQPAVEIGAGEGLPEPGVRPVDGAVTLVVDNSAVIATEEDRGAVQSLNFLEVSG